MLCERLSARACRTGSDFNNRMLLLVAWVFYPFHTLVVSRDEFGFLCLLAQHKDAEFAATVRRHPSAVTVLALFVAASLGMSVPACLPAGVYNNYARRFGMPQLTEHVFVAAQVPKKRRSGDAESYECVVLRQL